MRIFALGLVWAATLWGQSRSRFRWQDYCFNHPASPVCRGHEYAVKKPKPAKDAASQNVVTNPFPSAPENVTPSLIVVGGIDWRFADPFPDALVGFNFSGLSASPLARRLIEQLGASQGLTEVDMRKIFDGLSGVDQGALSVRDNRIVVMFTGRVTDSTVLVPDVDLKAVPVSGNAILIGHASAVDQAVERIAMKSPPVELTRLAGERQANSDFWAVGSAELVGPQAVSEGVKQFSLTVSIRNNLISDMAFEFDGEPSVSALRMWQTPLSASTLEDNVVHVRMSIEADEAPQKFGQIAASPLGQRLAAVVKAAQYLPVRVTAAPRQARPVIYGLDSPKR